MLLHFPARFKSRATLSTGVLLFLSTFNPFLKQRNIRCRLHPLPLHVGTVGKITGVQPTILRSDIEGW